MVDTKMQVRGNNPAQPEAPARDRRRQRRLQVLKDARPEGATVRVVPQEKYRATLKHQPSGIGFRSQGAATWPNDRFTQRRLRDGSVKLEQEKQADAKPEAKPTASRTTPPTPSSPAPSA